jgi:hypothetical protein
MVCTPGASVACVGTGGCAGGQVCKADGSGYGACNCGAASGSASGASGASAGSGSGTGSGTNGTSGTSDAGGASAGASSGNSGAASGNASAGSGSGTTGASGSSGAGGGATAGNASGGSGASSGAGSSSGTGSGASGGSSGTDSTPPTVAFTGACVNNLSNIGNGNFRMVVTLTPSPSPTGPTAGTASLLNQRKGCLAGDLWDLTGRFATNATFTVGITLDDTKGNLISLTNPYPIVDSGVHTITVTRINGTLYISADTVPWVSTPALTSFGTLAPLLEKTGPCIGVDGTKPFFGTIDSLCIQTM